MRRKRVPMVWFVTAVAAGALVISSIVPAWSAEPAAAELLLISTRDACDIPPPTAIQLPCWHLGKDNQWVRADQAPFLAADCSTPNIVFVHGNRTNACEAVEDGWGMYLALKKAAAGRPFRLVIWSWPSDRIQGGDRLDVQVKAARSELDSYYLAATLDRMGVDTPTCLIGYSFGADDRRDSRTFGRRRICRSHTSSARRSPKANSRRTIGSGHGCKRFGPVRCK